MNTRRFRAKPLSVAIASALSMGLAFSITAQAAVAADTQSAVPAQTAPASGQTAATPKTPAKANKKKRQSNAQKEVETLKTVYVTGIAGSQERDIILKRYASQIEDSITAQSIGQLPDVTISDAIARIPGVQIGRSGGEGTTVSVRGLPQVQTTLNGEMFLSPGGGGSLAGQGQPDLDSGGADFVDIPPTLFEGVDVIKSIMASNVAGGVSGIINLRTHRPFDFKQGWTFSGSATGNWGDRTRKLNKGGSFLGSYRTDRWGALLTASYSNESIANKQPNMAYYGSGEQTTEQDVGFDFNGDGVIGNSLDPNKVPKDYYYQWDPKRFGSQTTQRKRTGINGSFEFKFNDALKLIADAAYTKLDEADISYAYQFQDNSTPGGLQPGPVKPVITPEGVLLKGINNFDQVTQMTANAHGPTTSLNTNIQLQFDNGGLFSGELRWVHGKAHRYYTQTLEDSDVNQGDMLPLPDGTYAYDNPNGVPNGIPVLQNYEGKYPSLHVLEDITDPSKWVLLSAYANANKIKADMNVFRGDGTLHFDTGVLDSFQFGGRYEKQDFAFDSQVYLTPISPAGACADPLGPGPYDAYYRYIDPRLTDSCSGFSEIPTRQLSQLPAGWMRFFNNFSPLSITGVGEGKEGFPAVNAAVMRDPVAFLEQVDPKASGKPALYQHPTSSYKVDEKVESIYGQFNLSGQIGAIPWHANAGMRGVRTTLYIGSFLTDPNDFIGNGGAFNGVLTNLGEKIQVNKYTSWLPAVNISFDITPDQKLRLAFNRTQARQSLSNLGQGLSVYYGANGTPPRNPSLPASAQLFSSGSSGNPNLKPYASRNYDVSYAWYFNPHSIAYLGAFFMDVSAFPENVTRHENLPDADGVVRAGGPVSTIINGGGAIVKGFEAEFRTQFDFLPGWWNGFGVNLNGTYFPGSTNAAEGSTKTYNAVVFYQKYGLQARLAYNWTSTSFDFADSSVGGDTLNVYAKPEGYLDASIEYAFNKHVSLVLQATNLTDSYDPEYVQYPNAFWSANISERRYYAGVRVKF